MFTGLIQQVGRLVRRETARGGARLVIGGQAWNPSLTPGESIAVNGACLTVTECRGVEFNCDVLQETLARTTLGDKSPGSSLNLERALRLGESLGGHLLTGHIDGAGTIVQRQAVGRDWVLRIACDHELLHGIVPKGSIAVDGVSLTVAELDARAFTVHLIPFTGAHTALGSAREKTRVNLETDLLGKYVFRYLAEGQKTNPLTLERLRQAGFGPAPA